MIDNLFRWTLGSVIIAGFLGCYTGPNMDGGSAPTPAGASPSSASAGAAAGGLPCAVQALLAAQCSSCHSNPPKTAPMALVTYADLEAPSASDPSRTVAAVALERMTDAKRPMPPSGAIPAADIDAFAAWVHAGTPALGCSAAKAPALDGGGGDCSIASDCGGNLICRNGLCDVECVHDKDCTPGFVCRQTLCQSASTAPLSDGGNDAATGTASSVYRDITDTSAWVAADLGSITKTTYNGSAFDGRYVYFAPDGASGKALRFDTDATFSSISAWSVYDLTALDARAMAYRGAVYDGRYVYLVPSGPGGVASRFDTRASFTSDAAWSQVAVAGINASYRGFTGATFDGRYVYMVPAFGTVTMRLDTKAEFTSNAAWSSFDIASAASSATSFAGAVYDGKYVYYVPWRSTTTGSSIITRYDPQGAFGSASSWSTLDLTTLNPNAKGFRTASFDGRYLYLVPGWTAPTPSWSATTLARFDTTASFAATSAWTFYDVGSLGADAGGFNSAAFDGRYLVFSPGYGANGAAYRGTAYRYDTTASLSAPASWTQFAVTSLRSSLLNLKSSAFDGRYVYFAPVGGVASRYEARTTRSMPTLPAFNGSFF